MLALLVVLSMSWFLASDAAEAPGPTIVADAKHDGTDLEHAIVITAADDLTGVQAEYNYLGTLKCGNGGLWEVERQSTIAKNGRHYDKLDVRCNDGGAKRSFFFDSTSYFGKI